MFEGLTNEEKIMALENAIPQLPQVYELGGDYYYKCHWKKCNEDLKRYWRCCPNCGQRVLWKDE